MAKVKVVEVGPRDGLQNEKKNLSVAQRVKLIKKLSDAGLKHIEVGAFVSPLRVPQMKNTDQVVHAVYKGGKPIAKNIFPSALVPNEYGLNLARQTELKEIAVFAACSEAFSKKNINCTIKQSLSRFSGVISQAKKEGFRVRAYLSTAFGCPYEGKVSLARVSSLTEKFLDMGAYEVSIGDTIGVATPKQVEQFLRRTSHLPRRKIAMHFHDTRGTALANVLKSLEEGVRSFDSSVGGLGGCPYAKGSSGNLATEELVYMLEGMGFQTGVNLKKLIQIRPWLEPVIGRQLPSRVSQAGL